MKKTYKLSFKTLLIEITAVNLVLLIVSIMRNLPSNQIYILTIFVNLVIACYALYNLKIYKIYLDNSGLEIHFFNFLSPPTIEKFFYNELSISYKYELSGRGIKQKKIRFYSKNEAKGVLEPGITGWKRDDLEEIVLLLKSNNVPVLED